MEDVVADVKKALAISEKVKLWEDYKAPQPPKSEIRIAMSVDSVVEGWLRSLLARIESGESRLARLEEAAREAVGTYDKYDGETLPGDWTRSIAKLRAALEPGKETE